MSQSPMVNVTCHCNLLAKRWVSHTKDNPNRPFFRCPNDASQCKFFAWEDSLVSPDSQPTPSTPLERLDDDPTQSTQANSQSPSQGSIERDVFSASQSQTQPEAEYTLTCVPMPTGEGLPTPSSSSQSPQPFHDGSSSLTAIRTASATLALLALTLNELNELHESEIHTLERQKIAAEKERDDKSKELEHLEAENKRLNESFQSLQSDLADHKNTIRALNAALLQYSQDSRPRGDMLTLSEATFHYTANSE